jgi:hypothetical protein
MEPDKNKETEQSKTTDPQEDEKNGNVLGKAFDAVFGDAEGGGSISEEEDKEPGKQESIKDSPSE